MSKDCDTRFNDLLLEVEAIMESTPDGLYTTDAKGNILRFNSMLGRILGIDTSVLAGNSLKELKEKGCYPENVALMSIEQKKSITLTQELPDGRHVIISSYPIFRDSEVAFTVTKIRDMDELSQMQDELEAFKRLSSNYYNELKLLRKRATESGEVVVQSEAMKNVADIAYRIASVDTTVLLFGESGTGKEVIAKIIHTESKRNEGPFIKINCGAIPENLLESELFGYAEGSFTGAGKGGKPGLLEVANGGTLLLDEIGDLPLSLQVKLLRVLQDQEYYRIGDIKPTRTDIRIIAATNRNLLEMVKSGNFREDLYYRLNVVQIIIPPLRERIEDIIPLIYNFLKKYNQKYNFNKDINSDVVDELLTYSWPGNVRELENTIENMLVLSPNHTIEKSALPKNIFKDHEAGYNIQSPKDKSSLEFMVNNFEKKLIENALAEYGNMSAAAKALGLHRTTLARKLHRNRS
ncbi:MAG: sigma 54-interacting transcriptional regulator [Eubacteriaceae bacterium]|nr:sigma 54-interacting transcriptional regulator [Eubacteriaceae bacterium]